MRTQAWKALSGLVVTLLILLATPAHAALIGVVPLNPEIYTAQVTTANDWQNQGGGHGTLTIDGAFTGSVSTGTYTHPDGSTTGSLFYVYSLTLDYDSSYNFLSGSVSVSLDGSSSSIPGVANPGDLIMMADLTAFGFAGSGASGVMDFTFDITGGAWNSMGYAGASGGGIIDTLSGIDAPPFGAWTAANLLGHDWTTTGTGNFADTVVPVPAALWLFLSGMAGLAGVSMRRHYNV